MNRTMQKWLAGMLAMLMLLSLLAGCAAKQDEAAADSTDPSAATDTVETEADPGADTAETEVDTAADAALPEENDDDVDGELIVDHEEELQYAQSFSMTHYKGGYISFKILGGDDEHLTYLVVPEGKSVPEGLDEDYVILQQPFTSVRCCAGSASTINAFGGLDRVTNVTMDVSSFAVQDVIDAMNEGKIVFSGASKEPDYEMLMDLQTQIVFDNGLLMGNEEVKEKYAELGIPCLAIRNSKEVHPLGYNEWAKVLGAVLGMWDEANAYFDACVESVNALADLESTGKTVALMYCSSDGTKFFIPRGGDCWGKLVELAGGVYATKESYEPDQTGTGTVSLEDGFALFHDADYIVCLNMAAKVHSLDEMFDLAPIMADCRAVQEGHLYIAIDRIYQFNYDYAGMIASLNEILTDNSVTQNTYFYLAE